MTALEKRVARVMAKLQSNRNCKAILIYADGSSEELPVLEAVGEAMVRTDIVRTECENETTRSFLNAFIGAATEDFSNIPEIE